MAWFPVQRLTFRLECTHPHRQAADLTMSHWANKSAQGSPSAGNPFHRRSGEGSWPWVHLQAGTHVLGSPDPHKIQDRFLLNTNTNGDTQYCWTCLQQLLCLRRVKGYFGAWQTDCTVESHEKDSVVAAKWETLGTCSCVTKQTRWLKWGCDKTICSLEDIKSRRTQALSTGYISTDDKREMGSRCIL